MNGTPTWIWTKNLSDISGVLLPIELLEYGQGNRIRTYDSASPSRVLWPTELFPDMAEVEGLEPPTSELTARRTTIVLYLNMVGKLGIEPRVCWVKASWFTINLLSRMVGEERFELSKCEQRIYSPPQIAASATRL